MTTERISRSTPPKKRKKVDDDVKEECEANETQASETEVKLEVEIEVNFSSFYRKESANNRVVNVCVFLISQKSENVDSGENPVSPSLDFSPLRVSDDDSDDDDFVSARNAVGQVVATKSIILRRIFADTNGRFEQ